MRVVIAPDSFGGTLTAVEAARELAAGWRASAPADELVLVPVSDGGPGFVDVLAATLGGKRVTLAVEDPLARTVAADYLRVGPTAYVEAAQACGLHLLAVSERDPGRTTTYGVGQLVFHALNAGAARVVVGLGGSATNDGGAGLLGALGVPALDAAGERLPPGGAALNRVRRLDATRLHPRLRSGPGQAQLVVATDVDSPLLGITGASAVYGPQKGADAGTVQRLDAALTRWADVVARDLPGSGDVQGDVPAAGRRDVRDEPGAGAAGGLGMALLALGGSRTSGIDLVLTALRLGDVVAGADLVVTGEGSFDWQSLRGKATAGVAALAQRHGVPCLALAGQVHVGSREAAAAGIDAAYDVVGVTGSVQAALADPRGGVRALAERVARQWSTVRP